MTTVTRATVRLALKTSLDGVFGSLVPAANRYAHRPADVRGAKRALIITSDGSNALPNRFMADKVIYRFLIEFWVAYNDPADSTWNAEDCESETDALSEALLDWLKANRASNNIWLALEYEGLSTTASIMIGGREYRRERAAIQVEVQ